MNRFEFLSKLSASLSGLTPEDRRRVTDYYTEMIDDRMEEGLTEEEAIASIGDPENDAREMLSALGIECADRKPEPSAEPQKTPKAAAASAGSQPSIGNAAENAAPQPVTGASTENAAPQPATGNAAENTAANTTGAAANNTAPRNVIEKAAEEELRKTGNLSSEKTYAADRMEEASHSVTEDAHTQSGEENRHAQSGEENAHAQSENNNAQSENASAVLSEEAIQRAIRNISVPEKAAEPEKTVRPQRPARRRRVWTLVLVLFLVIAGTIAAVKIGKASVQLTTGLLPFGGFGNAREETTISGDCGDIKVITTSGDVKLEAVSGSEVKVKVSETAVNNYEISNDGGQLVIEYKSGPNILRGFIFPFGRNDTDIVIGVPLNGRERCSLENVQIETSSGDIELAKNLSVQKNLNLKTTSGDIRCSAVLMCEEEAVIETSSGDIDCVRSAGQPSTAKKLSVKTNSGDIEISGHSIACLEARSTSGDIRIRSIALSEFIINSTSGEVELSEAGDSSRTLDKFSITTTSGDVELKLNKVPEINTKTNSGRVSVSRTDYVTKEPCEIRTTSGDIIVK